MEKAKIIIAKKGWLNSIKGLYNLEYGFVDATDDFIESDFHKNSQLNYFGIVDSILEMPSEIYLANPKIEVYSDVGSGFYPSANAQLEHLINRCKYISIYKKENDDLKTKINDMLTESMVKQNSRPNVCSFKIDEK